MAHRRIRRNKKWLPKMLFLILLVGAIVICYFVWDAYFKVKENGQTEKEETVSVIEEKKKEEQKPEDVTEILVQPEITKEEVPQFDEVDSNQNETITGVITYAGVSGEVLMIRVNIDQYLGSGSCELSLKQNGQEVFTDRAGIIDSAATATCEGFNVPIKEIGPGKVNIKIIVSSNDKSGTINGEVKI